MTTSIARERFEHDKPLNMHLSAEAPNYYQQSTGALKRAPSKGSTQQAVSLQITTSVAPERLQQILVKYESNNMLPVKHQSSTTICPELPAHCQTRVGIKILRTKPRFAREKKGSQKQPGLYLEDSNVYKERIEFDDE